MAYFRIVFIILFLAYFHQLTNAQIPRMLSYQGVLTDSLGNPKPDNLYNLTFRLYDVMNGGYALWSETKTLSVKRGLFSTILGDQTSLPDSLRFDRPYWLSLQVASEPELSPRIPLTAVGYSLYSIKSDTAKVALTAPLQTFVDSARIAGTIPDNTVTSAKIANGTIKREDVESGFVAPKSDTALYALSATQPSFVDSSRVASTIPDNSVTSAKIMNGTIQRSDVASNFSAPYSDTASYARVAPQSGFVDSARIAGTIPDNSVTNAKITNSTIQFGKIAQNGATTGQVMKWNGLAWTAGNDSVGSGSQWQTLGTSLYYSEGKVGIGSLLTGTRLTINDSINGLGVFTVNPGGTLAKFGSYGVFSVDAPGVAGGRFNILENGNVGIGTASPNTRLRIHSTSGAGNLQLTSASTGSTISDGFVITNDGSTRVAFAQNENDDMIFSTHGYLNLDLKPNGNVGVGTLTPSTTLEVQGDVTISKGDGPRLILKDNYVAAERPRISFSGDPLAIFDGDTSMGHVFSFMNTFSATRNYDAYLRVHGKTAGSWGTYLDLTHDGTKGIITTDLGNIVLSPATKYLDVLGSINILADSSYRINNIGVLSSKGTGNIFVGNGAGFSNTTGSYNTANGYHALYTNNAGNLNIAIGKEALYSNTNGSYNTAVGKDALYSNSSGSYNNAIGMLALSVNTSGNQNTANGVYALNFNSTGNSNTATGYQALNSNTTGFSNVAMGVQSLYNNTTHSNLVAIGDSALFNNGTGAADYQAICNTAVGSKAMYTNTTGDKNTASGFQALYTNTSGLSNTANGYKALYSNITGVENTASGYQSLYSNSTGSFNTAYGIYALTSNTTGSQNTAVGYNAGPNSTNLINTTCLGIEATATASNMVRIGNASVTSIGGQVGWTTLSDGRFKENVKEDVPGLDFITKLHPVTYQINRGKFNDFIGATVRMKEIPKDKIVNEPIIESAQPAPIVTGFIAQEVEEVAKTVGYDFSGVDKPQNENDYYGLRYGEFVVPLVKAIQEQQQIIQDLKKRIEELEKSNSGRK